MIVNAKGPALTNGARKELLLIRVIYFQFFSFSSASFASGLAG
jgi:hypothetical protein